VKIKVRKLRFAACLLFQRRYKANENCPEPRRLNVPSLANVISTTVSQGKWHRRFWIERALRHWEQHPDEAELLFTHYAGFAERYGGILKNEEVKSWQDVEEHTPHGFLAHLAGQGFNKRSLWNAAGLLFALHVALALDAQIAWKPEPTEWGRSVRELLHLSEERFVLIEASDEIEALLEAERIGKGQEFSYENPYGDVVLWKFVKVVDVQEIVRTEKGTEIFARPIISRRQGDII